MSVYLQLFLSYVKIGFSSFGGMTMIPMLQDEVVNHGWMTTQELMDMVAIAEMTPGSLGINCATFVGIRTAGFFGSFFTTLGVMTPSLTLTLLATIFISVMRGNKWMEAILEGIRPISFGMLVAVLFTMSAVFFKEEPYMLATVAWNRLLMTAMLMFIYLKYKISILKLIGIGLVMGLVLGF